MQIDINNNKYEIPGEFSFLDFTNKQFNRAFEEIFTGKSDLFIQGRAGSGKSLLIKLASKMLKNVIICSTTGITAMSLTADNITAYTIHSFFQIAPGEILDRASIKNLFGKHKDLLKKAEVIIIDEVSMMSNQMFDYMCDKIIAVTGSLPRMILFGDVMQLPPVIATDNRIVAKFYHDNYDDKYMFFNSFWFKDNDFKKIILRKSFRQDNDDLADMLFQVGYSDHSQDTLDYFNQRVMSIDKYEKTHSNFMYISPVNATVNKINNEYLQTLQGKEMWYKAEISSYWPKGKPVPDKEILLKEGAQIMCTFNHNNDGSEDNNVTYRNGQIGVVEELHNDHVIANIGSKKIKIVKSTVNNSELILDKHGCIASKNNGWYRQIDCKIAKSITVHKSQGKTLDAAYFIPGGWLPQGLVYVALSRITHLEGLGLSRALTMNDIKVNQEAWDFLEIGE
jgi:ATP-dependent exoDNAse (exonuclease V) alpha subunit